MASAKLSGCGFVHTACALGMGCLDERLDAAVRAARIVERDPLMIAASGHLLAVGRV